MNETPRTRHRSAAERVGLLVLSLLSLTGAIGLAVSVQGPLQVLLASGGFAAYVVLFGHALDGPALRRLDRPS